MKTPIASVKRPKKSNPVQTAVSSASTVLTQSLRRTPDASVEAIHKGSTLDLALSPMHNIRPVPKDSHHFPTGSAIAATKPNESSEDASEPKLSIETELYTHSVNDNGEGDSPVSTSWVGRRVDAIFSPVLSFLQGTTNSAATVETVGQIQAQSKKSNNLEKELDSDENTGVVSTMVREALRQARHDLFKDDNGSSCSSASNSTQNITDLSDNYDGIPTMTNTQSSGSQVLDVDGDVTMEYKLQHAQEVVANNSANNSTVYSCGYHSKKLQISAAAGDHDISEEGSDDEEDEFNPYLFIKCLPPYQCVVPSAWASRPKALPPLDCAVLPIPPICLVLDLDETLVHCTVEPVADADMIFPVEFNGTEYQVHVRCRPFLKEFLEAVSCKFEVVIFTASQQVYADKLLDKIDPEGKFIRHRMFRDSCLPVEGNFLKDLSVLGRDLSKAVLVDNSPHAFGYQVDNGIPIESWFDDPEDKELLKLEMFLRTLHGVDDVRDVVRKTFQTYQLVLDA